MRRFDPFATNPSSRRIRYLRAFLPVAIAAAGMTAAAASHEPPVIQEPADGELLATSAVTVRGAAPGDAVAVRLLEGTTILAEVGTINGAWTATVSPGEGSHTVRARARDAAGGWSVASQQVTFIIDTISPPAPAVTAPGNGQLLAFDLVTVEGNAEPGATVLVTVDTGGTTETVADAAGEWSIARRFENATHEVTARARDAAGNLSLASAPVAFTVDTRAPAAPVITSPAPGASMGAAAIAVKGIADPGSLVTVSEGAALGSATSAADGTWSVPLVFAEGAHTVEARARDAAGNVGLASSPVSFTVDLTAPAAPVILSPQQNAIVPSRVTLRGTAEPRATVFLTKGDAFLTTTTADASGVWRLEQTLEDGAHTYRARARDAAGNFSALSPTRAFTSDGTAPRVVFTTPEGAILTPATSTLLEGTAHDNLGVASVELEYYDLLGHAVARVYAQCFSCPGQNALWRSDHYPGAGRFTVKAYAIDRAGNRSLAAIRTFVRL